MQKNNKSNTPIADFVRKYEKSGMSRFHMPGHKGVSFLGCEPYDITEIKGADSLYEADGIIAESEKIATELFGSGATFYSTEGSSQCIRAMLYLALLYARDMKQRPLILAARNVHKAFIYAATLLDFDVVWLWPEEGMKSLCSCHVSAETLKNMLNDLKNSGVNVTAVYITCPDYLGGLADIQSIAEICHDNDTLLLVDNAHGAYLHFLEQPIHPLDLGADLCCDSAHKTFPVLTGGAYLHISKRVSEALKEQAKHALCLFGSTSPSYLIMSSLDLCNAYLQDDYGERLAKRVEEIEQVRAELTKNGWNVEKTDLLRITVGMPGDISGQGMAEYLRKYDIECEYADDEFLVFMVTPENTKEDLDKLVTAFRKNESLHEEHEILSMAKAEQKMSIRDAMFSRSETVAVSEACGRICRTPTVSCPPAIPIAVPGEVIGENAIALFKHYGIEFVDVVK